MEHFGINSYAKRSIKVDGRYYHKRKESVLSHSKEVNLEDMVFIEKLDMVKARSIKTVSQRQVQYFQRVRIIFAKMLAGDRQQNFSQEEVKNRLERCIK